MYTNIWLSRYKTPNNQKYNEKTEIPKYLKNFKRTRI